MQSRRKMLFHKWIAFLMIAGYGVLLTWAMMHQLLSGQPVDYPAFLERIHSDIRLRSVFDFLDRYITLICALWRAVTMVVAEMNNKMPMALRLR